MTPMPEYLRDRLLFECGTMRAKLNYEIEAAEKQLTSVKKRLEGLTHDLYTYLGFIFIPLVVMGLLSILLKFSGLLLEPILTAILLILLILWFMSLPLQIYHLLKTCMLIKMNKKDPNKIIAPPPREGTYKNGKIPLEANYQTEYQKLLIVLTKYYLHVEQLDQIEKEIQDENCTMNMADLKVKLMQMTFYEDIRPADVFSSPMANKAKFITLIICFGVIMGVVSLIMILLI